MSRKERKQANRRNYVAASYVAARHYARLATYAMSQVRQGKAVNFR